MPLLVFAIGGGLFLAGYGIDKAATGTSKAAVSVALLGGAYLIAKKKGVI